MRRRGWRAGLAEREWCFGRAPGRELAGPHGSVIRWRGGWRNPWRPGAVEMARTSWQPVDRAAWRTLADSLRRTLTSELGAPQQCPGSDEGATMVGNAVEVVHLWWPRADHEITLFGVFDGPPNGSLQVAHSIGRHGPCRLISRPPA